MDIEIKIRNLDDVNVRQTSWHLDNDYCLSMRNTKDFECVFIEDLSKDDLLKIKEAILEWENRKNE